MEFAPVLTALLIFGLRIVDVSIGTVRVIYTIRGVRMVSFILGVLESGVWIFAITRLIKLVDNPLSMVAWALGFGAGTAVGIAIEQWIASGLVLVRVISRNHAIRLRASLIEEGYGVTAIRGQGRDQEVLILFVVARRKMRPQMIRTIQSIDPEAFITIDSIAQAIGGVLPAYKHAADVRK
jgi:uncharacterized protein YebE (UPF0316 family)